jgi:hypothetical protein
MLRTLSAWLAGAALCLGCTTAYDSPGGRAAEPGEVAAPEAGALAPYGMELIGEDGARLPTYQQGGRHYVLGEAGRAYQVRITNPTDHRIEAVVTVDGLDVIDGEPGDVRKRGYVVPAGGELRIEGFRTSVQDVATFRFSSVDASYAGRKGKARNVGVIAVALFHEVPPQELVLEEEPSPRLDDPTGGYPGRGDADEAGGEVDDYLQRPSGGGGRRVKAADRAPAASEATGGAVAPSRPAPPPDREEVADEPAGRDGCCGATRRPGLGTEYGERRYSAARWTKFVRAGDAPAAFAELRYNDAAGLTALGIPVTAPVDDVELTRRETADPFPGDPSFSRPPAGVR